MDIDNYNWEELYQKAETYIHEYIPEAAVNKGCRAYLHKKPRVEVIFPYRGNKSSMVALENNSNFRRLRGYIANGNKMIRGEVIFSTDGEIK